VPAAVKVVTRNAAQAVGLHDRGEIAPGLRGDLLRVRVLGSQPLVRETWVQGRRVA
jgi:alpha-D-ribose 1-methylphosphonate 5-triphosphate diphosphatase